MKKHLMYPEQLGLFDETELKRLDHMAIRWARKAEQQLRKQKQFTGR